MCLFMRINIVNTSGQTEDQPWALETGCFHNDYMSKSYGVTSQAVSWSYCPGWERFRSHVASKAFCPCTAGNWFCFLNSCLGNLLSGFAWNEHTVHLSRAIAFLFSSAACSARSNCTSPSHSFFLSRDLGCMGNSIYGSVFFPFSYLCVQGRIQSCVYISVPKKRWKKYFSLFCVWYKSKGSFACDNTQPLRLWSTVRV